MSIKSIRNYFRSGSAPDPDTLELSQYGQLGRGMRQSTHANVSASLIVNIPNSSHSNSISNSNSNSNPNLLSHSPPTSSPPSAFTLASYPYNLPSPASRSESPTFGLSQSHDSGSRKKSPPRLSSKSRPSHYPKMGSSAPPHSSNSNSTISTSPPKATTQTTHANPQASSSARQAARIPTVSNILALSSGPAATAVIVDINKSLRDQYLNRFLVAEKSYLRSLHVLLVCYMNSMTAPEPDPREPNGLMPPSVSVDDINLIFRNIVELRKAHSLFLRNLISRTKLWTSSSQFGDVVYAHIEATELLYRQYIDNLPHAVAKLDELLKQTPELAYHLRGCEALADGMRRTETEDEMKDFTLRGLLHEPVLIVHKYFGLLQGIRKALKSDDPDVFHLGKALAVIAPLTLLQVPSMSQAIPQEQDAFLEYSVKVEHFNEFRKTAAKVIKSARKLVEHETERLHEYASFAENLYGLQTAYECGVSPELGGAFGNYSNLWKKLGDLRSEMLVRQRKSFIGPLMADLEAFEKVFGDLEKQHTITQAANHEYQHARQKAMRNAQGGKKLSLELSSHYQKRVVTNARREFDALLDVATGLQEKVLLHLHAGLLAQIKYHEQSTNQITSHKEATDTVQNYLQTTERARWMKSLHSELLNAFSAPVVIAAGEEHPDYAGVNFDFDWLLKPYPTPAPLPFRPKYQPLAELLALESLALVNSLSVTCGDDQPRVLDSIVRVLDYYNFALNTIKKAITQEVAATVAPTTLFRTNTPTTKLMSAHSRVGLYPHLSALVPLIREVMSNPDGFEVDPTKLKDPGLLDANLQTLISMSRRFLEAIITKIDEWPASIKVIAKHLQNVVWQRFSDAKLKNGVLGGYTFLRFLCPSILSPNTWAPVEAPSPAAGRALLLITKVLQALANGQEFGGKEAFMKPVNPFVLENFQKLETFYDQLTSVDENVITDLSGLVTEEVVAADLHSLHSLINKNICKIAKSMYLYGHKAEIPRLVVAIVNLGDPTFLHLF
eukprot:Phypoly_transcript_01754.p1 GENE.Phypoly_transcript_01754~~Phypoly_transcript_01754.p1  ORF type:complete len:1009 (+),score=124.58 Phypoly_transcript_01754:82-3108(+)